MRKSLSSKRAVLMMREESAPFERSGKWCPPLAQNQQHAEPRPGERVVLWCLYDPDANEAKPWRVQWKEGGERMGTRKGRDDVRVKASRVCLPPNASLICLAPGASLTVKGPPPDAS